MSLSLLDDFARTCRTWYTHRLDPHCDARAAVYSVLVKRHEEEIVWRWHTQIQAVLDRVEAEVKKEILCMEVGQ